MASIWDLAPRVEQPPRSIWDLAPVIGGTPASPDRVKSISEAVRYGIQSTGTAMAFRGKMAEQQMDAEAPWYFRAAAGAAGVVTDLPLSIAGAAAAAPAGPIAMGAAGFGVPMALRDALIEAYSNNHATTWEGVWEIAKAGLGGGAKGAVIGAATLGAGRAVGAALPAATGTAARVGAVAGAELATMTTTAAALEGRLPTEQEFLDNAILLGGLKGAVGTAKALRNIYVETGKRPDQVALEAKQDPQLKSEILGDDPQTARLQKALSEMEALTDKYKDDFAVAQELRSGDYDRAVARAVEAHKNELSPSTMDVLMSRWARDAETGESIPATESVRGTHVFNLKEEIAQRRFSAEDGARNTIPEAYRQLAMEERVKAALAEDQRPALVQEMLTQMKDPEAPLKLDPVRYEYITDAQTAESVVRAVADAYKAEVELQRRGTVPAAASLAEGVRMVETGELQARTIGAGANSAEIAARALLTKGAAEQAKRLAETMPSDPALQSLGQKLEFAAAMERVGLFYGELAGAGAEAGRALNMLRQIKRNPDMLGDAARLVELYERKAPFSDLAAAVRGLKDPEQVRRFAKEMEKATTTEMFLEGWKAAILSGPLTFAANVMGNVGKWAIEVPEAALTAALTAAQRKMAGDPMSMAQFKAKAFAPIIGMQLGAKDALTTAAAILRSDIQILDKADVYKTAIPGKVGEVVRLPFRVLQATDALFRVPAERGKAYELAVDRVVKEGLHPETMEAKQRIAAYTQEPTLGLTAKQAESVTKTIEKAGAEAVFAQRLGPFLESMQGNIARNAPALGLVVPFIRTPANLVSWAVQHTPGLNVMSGRWRADFAAGGEARNQAIARVAVGTAIASLAISLADGEMITGGGLFDPEMARTKAAAGWQPYSIKIGDTYYSYQRMEPIAKVLGLAADMIELMNSKKLDEADAGKIAAMMVLMFGNATVSTTYLSGLANTMNAVLDPDRHGESWVEGYASSVVPKIVGQTTMMADPYKREVTGALDAIQAQLPYFRQQLVPKRDAWGEPAENNRWFNVLPVATSKEATEKVKTEAVRLQIAIADAPKSVVEKGPFKPSDKKIELTDVERDIFRQVSGGAAMEILRPIVNSADWDRIPEYAQAAIYRDVLKDARVQAAWKASPPGDPRRDEVRRKLLDKITTQNAAAEQKAPAIERVLRYNDKGQR